MSQWRGTWKRGTWIFWAACFSSSRWWTEGRPLRGRGANLPFCSTTHTPPPPFPHLIWLNSQRLAVSVRFTELIAVAVLLWQLLLAAYSRCILVFAFSAMALPCSRGRKSTA
jgi:hypothetical protein